VRLRVAGLGPGAPELMTPQVRAALEEAEVIVGYTRYLAQVPQELTAGKELVSTGMTGEMARVDAALDAALAGRSTVLVCGGDAGVYALAGLALELAEARGVLETLDLEILPGIPALAAGAALLGAPLTHDFACVSLSDRLTPWELIVRRLEAAAGADFVLALYNPRSRGREGLLAQALDMVRRHRGPDTPAGVVRNAYRPGQRVWAGRLADLDPEGVDMLSIVFIGAASTRLAAGRMLTPRGYLGKYGYRPGK
jgi:precorrin-3B C17-methyltransferase